jgi:hypothetical protein
MQNVMNPLMTMYQTQLEASRRLADALFSGTEKIDRVMIGATHRVFTDQLNLAQAMTTVRDPRNVGTALQSSLLSRNSDDAVNYQKEIMRIFAEMQNEIGRSLHDYIEQLGTHAASSATKPLEAAQTHANDAVFNPMTSMFSVWESAFKEVAELAKKNMATARATAENAAGRTMQHAGNYADVTASAIQEAASGAESMASTTAYAARSVGGDGSDDKRGGTTSGGTK